MAGISMKTNNIIPLSVLMVLQLTVLCTTNTGHTIKRLQLYLM